MTCPLCNSAEVKKVVYYGLPVKMCFAMRERGRLVEPCNCMFGCWTLITNLLPFNGCVLVYEGSYLKAMWHWLFGDES